MPTSCGVQELTTAQRKTLEQQALMAFRTKLSTNAAFTAITYVPLRPHILRKSDGTGGMSLSSINQVIALTNSYYLQNGSGIQFYFAGTTPDYVDNDNTYACYNSSKEAIVTQGHDVTNALNQYYINQFCDATQGGYAYYPGNDISSTRSFVLNEADNLDDMGNRLVPHELGHNFNLLHTFAGPNSSSFSTELVTRGVGANCTTDGDLICDTPADPYNKSGATLLYDNNGCPTYDPSSTARDANNEPYAPSISNIMSYYFACTHEFTAGQYDRMQAGLAVRQTHTAYSLTYPATLVTTPTNLAATLSSTDVILTWQDNAANEMGYFIERSLLPTTGFVPIGGVGPNEVTFMDTKTAPLKTYYYRIRPSNSTTAGISQVVSIQTPACHPTYLEACTFPVGLGSVAVNNSLLSQNSGCSPDGYGVFPATTTVQAGLAYPISGTFLYGGYIQGVTAWADLNRDGAFDSSQGEQLFQTPSAVTGQFSGVITLPASLTSGGLPIRIVTIYGEIPTEPCGAYFYGETEDYMLTVNNPVAPADLSVSFRTSVRTLDVNQPASYSLTIYNNGPNNASGVRWQNLLPSGLVFVSGDPTVTASTSAVSGASAVSLAVGQSITTTYRLQPTVSGTFRNAVQITSSNQPDPDSQPASGTGDGQDDQASVDIRTRTSSETVYTSPNPDQVPLPSVVYNQPAPDPAKADLSIRMQASSQVVQVGQPFTFTITVQNQGGLPATNVVLSNQLPTGLQFVSSADGMTVNGSIVGGSISTIPVGESISLTFVVQATSTGTFTNKAQILSVNQQDPDSTPGNGYTNGEDDQVSLTLRTR